MPIRSMLPLPPGNQEQSAHPMFRKRDYLLEKYLIHGPVFAENEGDNLHITVIGLPTAHQLLVEHAHCLDVVWMDLSPLFAQGDIRTLSEATHQIYRRAILKAVNTEVLLAAEPQLAQVIARGLSDFQQSNASSNDSDAYRQTLNIMATSLLVRLFYGADPSQALHQELVNLHLNLGPKGLAWNISAPQIEYFAKIKSLLKQQLVDPTDPSASSNTSILKAINHDLRDDETMIGNLIYMVETGRADFQALFRWVTKFACDLPQALKTIAVEGYSMGDAAGSQTESFIKETLRMAQSERVVRTVNQDIEFDGMLIPKGAKLTICLWEAHQLAESFNKPAEFDPYRFTKNQIGSDKYSPFGLGTHRCPMNNYVPKIAGLFLSTLATTYELNAVNNGEPMRGLYHWQPSDKFTVELEIKA